MIALKRKPTNIIPTAIIPANVSMNWIFSTFFRIIISGRERPITAIMNANAVPSDAPFSINTDTIGMIPAAFEYSGIPITTDNGTLYHADLPINEAMKSSGTYPGHLHRPQYQ